MFSGSEVAGRIARRVVSKATVSLHNAGSHDLKIAFRPASRREVHDWVDGHRKASPASKNSQPNWRERDPRLTFSKGRNKEGKVGEGWDPV